MRTNNFHLALKKYGLDHYNNSVLASRDLEIGYWHAVRRLIRFDPPPSAIVVYRDGAAAHALSELTLQGLRVPEDISLLAGSDSGIAELLHPQTDNRCRICGGDRSGSLVLSSGSV